MLNQPYHCRSKLLNDDNPNFYQFPQSGPNTNHMYAAISNSYFTGAVTGIGPSWWSTGGFAGYSGGGLTNNWWFNLTNPGEGLGGGYNPSSVTKAASASDFNETGSGV